MALFAKKTWLRKSHVLFPLRIMGFPQELKTMRFNLEPKRCKSVSLSAKRSVSTLVGLAHGVVTEKLRFPYKQSTERLMSAGIGCTHEFLVFFSKFVYSTCAEIWQMSALYELAKKSPKGNSSFFV